MSTKTTTILALVMIGLALLAGAIFWDQLPEQMAAHWNANDEVDGYISKFWGVFLMPLITLGMLGLFLVIPNIDPLKVNIAQFRESFNLFISLIVGFMLYIHGLTMIWSLGYQNFKMNTAMLPFLGVLFIAIGFMLKKARRNFSIGIRTPWTLSSDTVWDETHRVGSVLLMIAGGLAFLGAFVGGKTTFCFIMAPILASVLITLVYSYVLYQSLKAGPPNAKAGRRAAGIRSSHT